MKNRPRQINSDSASPAFLRAEAAGLLLSVKLQPRASASEIVGPSGAELRIKVTAPPIAAAANEALLRFLAETLGCARGQVGLVRGHTSRHKGINLQGLSTAAVITRLSRGIAKMVTPITISRPVDGSAV